MTSSLRFLVALGCFLRLFHFLRNPSVWHDEAALIVNVIQTDYRALLGPLLWNEAAPPLFLWLERTVVLLAGDSTYALRFLPMLASCLALCLFAKTATRMLPSRGAFGAVLLFAVSDRLLWHASEAKPYAMDVLLATLLIHWHVHTDHWSLTRRFALLTLCAPFAILLSYPACFLCGGLWLAMLPQVIRRRCWHGGAMFLVWSLAFTGAFAWLYLGPIHAQRTGPMEGCWAQHFPDWSRPWSVPGWTAHGSMEVLRYNFRPIGFLLAGLVTMGMIAWRHRSSTLTLLLAPPCLAWIASLVGGYPFGGSRLELFSTPALALLIGAGIEPTRDLFVTRRVRWGYVLSVVLLLIPAAWAAKTMIVPWPRADVARASQFIRENRQESEPVSANHWEYVYYFRDLPDVLSLDQLPSAARIWVAFTAPDPRIRGEAEERIARHGRIVLRREFEFTVVLLVDFSETVAQR